MSDKADQPGRAVRRAWENAGNEKSVCEIYLIDLPQLRQQGLNPRAILDRLKDIDSDNGLWCVRKQSQTDRIGLSFNDKGAIYFDGTDWYYRPPPAPM